MRPIEGLIGLWRKLPPSMRSTTPPPSFALIEVAGQGDVEADEAAGSLVLVAGSGIDITTDPATNEVEIAVDGSASGSGGVIDGGDRLGSGGAIIDGGDRV